jgi:hypothetical protein
MSPFIFWDCEVEEPSVAKLSEALLSVIAKTGLKVI